MVTVSVAVSLLRLQNLTILSGGEVVTVPAPGSPGNRTHPFETADQKYKCRVSFEK